MFYSLQDAKTQKSAKKPGCIYAAVFFTLLSSLFTLSAFAQQRATEGRASSNKPNIAFILSEDNGLYLGCYGDKNAHTPNLDQLAAEGQRYTNCFANAPVCAPARCTLLLGTYATTSGTHNMRSFYKVSSALTPFHHPLKKAGYFVTGSKGDYNNSTHHQKELWNGHAGKGDHFKRGDKFPNFFAVYNIGHSHESRAFGMHPINKQQMDYPIKQLKHPLEIPPYQIDNQATRDDWGKVYSSVEKMDESIGHFRKALEKNGEADNTIIFYIADHGGIMIRSKRYLYDSGTRVPFIAYFPEKWKHLAPKSYQLGSVSDRLVDFTDLTKTLLHLCDVESPPTYSGKIFAGKSPEPAKEKLLLFSGRFDESQDNSRALTDGRYKYIRNYEPDRRAHQLLQYPFGQDAQVAHYHAYIKGETNEAQSAIFNCHIPEEFYDTQSDPHEVNNLINSTTHQDLITDFRQSLDQTLLGTHDLGFIPEPLMESIDKSDTTIYDWAREEGNYPLKKIIALANLASSQKPANIPTFQKELGNKNPVMRYWAALGLRVLGKDAARAEAELIQASKDSDPSVRITALTTLGKIKGSETYTEALLEEAATAKGDMHCSWALGGLKFLEYQSLKDHPKFGKPKHFNKGPYSNRSAQDLLIGKTYTHLPE